MDALTNAIIAAIEADLARNQAHCRKIDALPLPGTPRVCLSAAGTRGGRFWLKSATYADGPGWQVKSTKWTAKKIQAGCFLPEVAVAIAKQFPQLIDLQFEKP